MAISRQALDQVRNILRELDQRIDSAREQRTSDPVDGHDNHAPRPSAAPGAHANGVEAAATPGRARPKRPTL